MRKLYRKPKYDHFYVLVCNIPAEENTNTYEKKIITALTKHWARKGYSKDNVHIIYLSSADSGASEKFSSFQHCTQHSKLWIVGHSKPGVASVRSNNAYERADGSVCKKSFKVSFIINLILQALIQYERTDCYCDMEDIEKITSFKNGCLII